MERIVQIEPAFDKRKQDPQMGICQAKMFFVLKGFRGAVIFSIYTGWYLPETVPWLTECFSRRPSMNTYKPLPDMVAYCSPKPLKEDQYARKNCNWIGGDCYGDFCSTSTSTEVFNILVSEGSEALWKWLEEFYLKTFGELK